MSTTAASTARWVVDMGLNMGQGFLLRGEPGRERDGADHPPRTRAELATGGSPRAAWISARTRWRMASSRSG